MKFSYVNFFVIGVLLISNLGTIFLLLSTGFNIKLTDDFWGALLGALILGISAFVITNYPMTTADKLLKKKALEKEENNPEALKKVSEIIDDIWKMSDSDFYKNVIIPLNINIKKKQKTNYQLIEFKIKLTLSKNQKKSLQERIRRYKENINFRKANENMMNTFIFTLIAIILSLIVFFISATKDYLGKLNLLIQKSDELKGKMNIDKIDEIEGNDLIKEINRMNSTMEELKSIFNLESNVFIGLISIIIICCGLYFYNLISKYIKYYKTNNVEMVLRQK